MANVRAGEKDRLGEGRAHAQAAITPHSQQCGGGETNYLPPFQHCANGAVMGPEGGGVSA